MPLGSCQVWIFSKGKESPVLYISRGFLVSSMEIPISHRLFEHLISTWAGGDCKEGSQVVEQELQELVEVVSFVG